MQTDLLNKILFSQLKCGREVEIEVKGVSMEPTLFEGDRVLLRSSDSYTLGDIVVFIYKNGELLIHRLLKIENGRYFCKGDNAFRLEDVEKEQIAGKVIAKNGGVIPTFSDNKIKLSLLVSHAFRKNAYQTDETKKSGIYRFYRNYINKTEDLKMTYQKNMEMDYIMADETSLAVFDPESGDTHLFDETAVDILNCLDGPTTLPEILDKLCEIYDATPLDIKQDVEDFLAECIAKNVVIAL